MNVTNNIIDIVICDLEVMTYMNEEVYAPCSIHHPSADISNHYDVISKKEDQFLIQF